MPSEVIEVLSPCNQPIIGIVSFETPTDCSIKIKVPKFYQGDVPSMDEIIFYLHRYGYRFVYCIEYHPLRRDVVSDKISV